MNETTRDTRDQELVGDRELNNGVKLFLAVSKHGIEFFRLRYRAREAIENKARGQRSVSTGTCKVDAIVTRGDCEIG